MVHLTIIAKIKSTGKEEAVLLFRAVDSSVAIGFPGGACWASFLIWTWLLSSSEKLGPCYCWECCGLLWGAQVFTASWLWRGRWYTPQSPEVCHPGFLVWSRLFTLSEEFWTSLSLRMAVILLRWDLVLTLSVASWLQSRTLSLLAQIPHPAGTDFLAFTTDPGAFPAQIRRSVKQTCMSHC